jgi:hypothetical protein
VRDAHRVVYEALVGPVPEGLELDHTCDNPPCCNPGHLEPVTHAENMRRGKRNGAVVNRAKTHCKHGHEFTPANTYTQTKGGRGCRECHRRVRRDYMRRRRAAA